MELSSGSGVECVYAFRQRLANFRQLAPVDESDCRCVNESEYDKERHIDMPSYMSADDYDKSVSGCQVEGVRDDRELVTGVKALSGVNMDISNGQLHITAQSHTQSD